MNQFFVRYPIFIYTACRWMMVIAAIFPLVLFAIIPAVLDDFEETVSIVQISLTLIFLTGFGALQFMLIRTVKHVFRDTKKLLEQGSSNNPETDSAQLAAVKHALRTANFLQILLNLQGVAACGGFVFFLIIRTRFQYIIFNMIALNPYSEAIIIPLLTVLRTEGGISPIQTKKVSKTQGFT